MPTPTPFTFTYDQNGNMTQKVTTRDTITLAWNADNKPSSLTRNGQTTTFTYDGRGRTLPSVLPLARPLDYNEGRNHFQ